MYILFYLFIFKDFIYLFLERGEGREKERERNIDAWVPLVCSPLGTWPTTQACALTRSRRGVPLLCSMVLSPLRQASQGVMYVLIDHAGGWSKNQQVKAVKLGGVCCRGMEERQWWLRLEKWPLKRENSDLEVVGQRRGIRSSL